MPKEIDIATVVNGAYQRLMDMAKVDTELAERMPRDDVVAALKRPDISYQEIIATVLNGYGDRPALGVRDHEIKLDQRSGRRVREFLPSYRTITYRELAGQIEAIASCWQHHSRYRVAPGEFVSFLSFSGAEMAAMDLACAYAQAVSVPMQANLAQADAYEILEDVNPVTLVASIENLERAVSYAKKQTSIRSLIVIDTNIDDDGEAGRVAAAREEFEQDSERIALATFSEIVAAGKLQHWQPLPRSKSGPDTLSMVMYTSGSSGTPKGALVHEAICAQMWTSIARHQPAINIAYAPMNHFMGRLQIYAAMVQGGTAFFTLKSDISTLFEDIRLVRPTTMSFMPRVCEISYQYYQSEKQRRVADGIDPAEADRQIRSKMRKTFLGDRLVLGSFGSSPTAPEIQDFMADCFDIAFIEGYGSTEAGGGGTATCGRIQRPYVIDYKLADVPELGYRITDKPYPRGELLVKTKYMIKGYFKRPEASAAILDPDGYLMTGDIMEERGPDHVVWLDRRSNVIKLSQAEFVSIGPLEAGYLANCELVKQIYVYGSSYRSFLLAVVVPDLEGAQMRLGHAPAIEELRALILTDLQQAARIAGLKSFEVPRDVLVEFEAFSLENGLLSSVRKPLRPNLKRRYADRLEAMYQEMDAKQQEELMLLRSNGAGLSVLDRVAGALRANLGVAFIDPSRTQSFTDLGGDSLGAVSLSVLLEEIFGILVPVSIILNPAGSLRWLAKYIERTLSSAGSTAPSFASVHGVDATILHAADFSLENFFEPEMLLAAADLVPPNPETRIVLLTGANGFLGRFLCLEWLERLAPVGGKVICMIRGTDAASARLRLDEAMGTADPELSSHFRRLADKHLEMIAGDLAAPRLGLSDAEFAELAASVDHIVHPAALVNHMLSYQNLFEPNVVGTAELIRLALTGRKKRFDYVSSIAVPHLHLGLTHASEDADVRINGPEVRISDNYALGYGASKWAGEVLLREAHAQFGLPVNVFRADMILPHSRYRGQINVPDMFTRLLFSLVKSGIAPKSFYPLKADGSRQRAHYDGLPVDFIAGAMQQIGAKPHNGFRTYNIINMHHDDGTSLDLITDWVRSAGFTIQQVNDHADWFQRFADKLRGLPDGDRQRSSLTIIGQLAQPQPASVEPLRSDNFTAVVRGLPIGPEIPHLSEAYIHKYLYDMRLLGLLPETSRMVA